MTNRVAPASPRALEEGVEVGCVEDPETDVDGTGVAGWLGIGVDYITANQNNPTLALVRVGVGAVISSMTGFVFYVA